MSAFNSAFAARSKGAQLVETGDGKSPSWTDYLSEKEFGAYEQAASEIATARGWGTFNAMGMALSAGLLPAAAPGGGWFIASLTAGAVGGVLAVSRHIRAKQKMSDLQTSAITRAMREARRSPSRHPSRSPL